MNIKLPLKIDDNVVVRKPMRHNNIFHVKKWLQFTSRPFSRSKSLFEYFCWKKVLSGPKTDSFGKTIIISKDILFFRLVEDRNSKGCYST